MNAMLKEVIDTTTAISPLAIAAVGGLYTIWPYGQQRRASLKNELEIYNLFREATKAEPDAVRTATMRQAINKGLDEVFSDRHGGWTWGRVQAHAQDWVVAAGTFVGGLSLVAVGVSNDDGRWLAMGVMLWLFTMKAVRTAIGTGK